MFSALPVMGLYILPAMVGSWWIDWTRWVRTGVRGSKQRGVRRGLLRTMARGGEGLETKMGTLGSGTGASGGTGGGSGGRITGAGAMEIGGSTTGGGVATISGGRDGTGGGLMARRRISATCA